MNTPKLGGKRLNEFKVTELRVELESRGLDKSGLKAELVKRLEKALVDAENNPENTDSVTEEITENENEIGSPRLNSPSLTAKVLVRGRKSTPRRKGAAKIGTATPTEEAPATSPVKELSTPEVDKQETDLEIIENESSEPAVESKEDVSEDKPSETNEDADDVEDITTVLSEEDKSDQEVEEVNKLDDDDLYEDQEDDDAEESFCISLERDTCFDEEMVETVEPEEAENGKEKKEEKEKPVTKEPLPKKSDTKLSDKSKDSSTKGDKKTSSSDTEAKSSGKESPKKEVSNSNESKEDGKQLKSLWVSGLSPLTRAADLKSQFGSFGKVIAAKVVTSTRPKGSQCYGFITMGSEADCKRCIDEFHCTDLHGRIISVEMARKDPTNRRFNTGKATNVPNDSRSPRGGGPVRARRNAGSSTTRRRSGPYNKEAASTGRRSGPQSGNATKPGNKPNQRSPANDGSSKRSSIEIKDDIKKGSPALKNTSKESSADKNSSRDDKGLSKSRSGSRDLKPVKKDFSAERAARAKEDAARKERQQRLDRERRLREEEKRREKDRERERERERARREIQEKRERDRRERERHEAERIHREKQREKELEKERERKREKERQRILRERRDREERSRLEKERLERERLELERLRRETIEREKMERERQERERRDRERFQLERIERERLQLERARLEKERMEHERERRIGQKRSAPALNEPSLRHHSSSTGSYWQDPKRIVLEEDRSQDFFTSRGREENTGRASRGHESTGRDRERTRGQDSRQDNNRWASNSNSNDPQKTLSDLLKRAGVSGILGANTSNDSYSQRSPKSLPYGHRSDSKVSQSSERPAYLDHGRGRPASAHQPEFSSRGYPSPKGISSSTTTSYETNRRSSSDYNDRPSSRRVVEAPTQSSWDRSSASSRDFPRQLSSNGSSTFSNSYRGPPSRGSGRSSGQMR